MSQPCTAWVIKDNSDVWPDEGMFVPDEHPFITAVRIMLKLSRWPADFRDKWDKFPRCFTLSLAGVGSSDGGVVRFRFT